MQGMGGMAAPLPQDPMAGGMDPMMGDPMAGMEQDPLAMLMQAVQGKWAGDQAQLAGEQDAVTQVLMQILGAGMEAPGPADMVEGSMAPMPADPAAGGMPF